MDTSTGQLSANGGFIIKEGVIVARTNTGTFIAVASACTHQGTNIDFNLSINSFVCPNHGSQFDTAGKVKNGPATQELKQFKTELNGAMLRVFE